MSVNAYSFGQGLHNVLALGQLAGGLLGLPATVQRQTQAAQMYRTLLPQLIPGLTPEQTETLAPTPSLQFLNPDTHGGTFGKILGGVGDVGTILQTLTGGAGPGAPPISLDVMNALMGRQLDRQKIENLKAYRERRLGFEERKTAATEKQAEASMLRAGRTGGDVTSARQGEDRLRRLALADTLGLTNPRERVAWIEKGLLPKGARELALEDFYRQELARPPAFPGDKPVSPAIAMRRAYQALERYRQGKAKVDKKTTAERARGADRSALTVEFDSSKLSAAGQIAAQRIYELVQAGRMDPEDGARKLAQLR